MPIVDDRQNSKVGLTFNPYQVDETPSLPNPTPPKPSGIAGFLQGVGSGLASTFSKFDQQLLSLPHTLATKAMGINAPDWTYSLKALGNRIYDKQQYEAGQQDPSLANTVGQFIGGAAGTALEAAVPGGLEADAALFIANHSNNPKESAGALLEYGLNKVTFGKGGEIASKFTAAGLKNTGQEVASQIANNGIKSFGPQFIQKVGTAMFKDAAIGTAYNTASAWKQNNNPTVQDLVDGGILGAALSIAGETFSLAKGKLANRQPTVREQANKAVQENSKNNPSYKSYLMSDLVDRNAPINRETLISNKTKTDFIVKAAKDAPGQFVDTEAALAHHGIKVVNDVQPGDVPFRQGDEIHVSPSTSGDQLYHEIGHVVESLIKEKGGDVSMFKEELAKLAPNETKLSEKFAVAARKVMTGKVSQEDFPFLDKAIKAVFGEPLNMNKDRSEALVLTQRVNKQMPKDPQPMTIGEKQIKASTVIYKQGNGQYTKENAMLLATKMDEKALNDVLGIVDAPKPDPSKMEALGMQEKEQPKKEDPAPQEDTKKSYREKLASDAKKHFLDSSRSDAKGEKIDHEYKSKTSADPQSEEAAKKAVSKSEIEKQRGPRLTKENLDKNLDTSKSSLDQVEQDLRYRKAGQITSVEGFRQEQQVLSNKAKALLELSRTADLTGSKEDRKTFEEAYQDFGLLYAAHKGSATEFARGLELTKSPLMPREYAEEFMKMVKDVKEKNPNAAADTFMAKLEKDMETKMPQKFWDKFSKNYKRVWYMSSISGISSFERAGIDNLMTAAQEDIVLGISRAVLRPSSMFREGGLLRMLSAAARGTVKGLREGRSILKGELIPSNERFFLESEPNKAMQAVGRAWAAMDRATLGASKEVYLAVKQDDAKQMGQDLETHLSNDFSDKEIEQMRQESVDTKRSFGDILLDRVGDKRIAELAKRGEMKGTLGKLGKWLSNGSSTVPGLWRLFPFIRTGINVARMELDYLPVASQARILMKMANGEFKAMDQFSRAEMVGKSVVGAMVFTGIASQVSSRSDYFISGYGPTNAAQRAQLYADGWRPYSIRIGDRWVPYSYWGPLGATMALAGSMSDVKHQATAASPNFSGQVTDAIFSWGKQTLSRSFLSGVDDFFGAFTSASSFEKWVGGSVLSSIVPNPKIITDTMTKLEVMFGVDNAVKNPQGIAEIVASRLGLDWTLPPMLDIYGNPVQKQYTSGVSQGIAVNDPVIKDLQDAGSTFGSVNNSFTLKNKKITLSRDDYQTYQKIYGDTAKQMYTQLFATEGWDSLSLQAKKKGVTRVQDRAKKIARSKLEASVPSILGSTENK